MRYVGEYAMARLPVLVSVALDKLYIPVSFTVFRFNDRVSEMHREAAPFVTTPKVHLSYWYPK